MDSVNHSAVYTPRKSTLAQKLTKAFIKRVQKTTKFLENTKKKVSKKTNYTTSTKIHEEDEEEEDEDEAAFLAKLFANISAVKAAYAQLQFAQFPTYDADEIQSADQTIISELNNLSELKQCYYDKSLNEIVSPVEKTLLLSEIQEHNSLLITYRITTRKLDSQLKLKVSEIIFLKEKLAEANELLEEKTRSLISITVPQTLSGLRPSHFVRYLKQAVESSGAFVRLLMSGMESADWNLELAAGSIHPGISFCESDHIRFAFASFVSGEMFDGFDFPNFSSVRTTGNNIKKGCPRVFFDRFLEMESLRLQPPGCYDLLACKGISKFFDGFCRDKYMRLVRPKMENSIFGSLEQRSLVGSGGFPETPLFYAFCEMAKDVWLLHCLALSFDPEVSIFQVSKGSRFSEVYMESLNDEAIASSDDDDDDAIGARVAFTVVPGFRIGKTVVQCQVYLMNQIEADISTFNSWIDSNSFSNITR
ncbi:hypothetical protein OROMI_017336 [Orobanche minor]